MDPKKSVDVLPLIRMTVRVYRPIDEVWKSFLDPILMLQWLGNEISADIREGGEITFQGPNAPVCAEIEGKWVIRRLREDNSMLLSWSIMGVDTLVVIRFTKIPPGTLIEVKHGAIPTSAKNLHLPEHWTLLLANFRSVVELGVPALRFDYTNYHPMRVTMYDSLEVRQSVVINAPPSLPFDVWTNPEKLSHFIGVERPIVDTRYGGIYTWWAEGKGPVVFTKIDPDKELEFSWVYGDELETRVNIRFEPVEDRTLVMLHHFGFKNPESVIGYNIGWASILSELKLVCELGDSGIERASLWEEVRL
ncbi:MAG: SRPBCC family protein [Candidatus Thorarchaeota archaeon]